MVLPKLPLDSHRVFSGEECSRDEVTRETIDQLLEDIPPRFRDWTPFQYATAVLLGLVCLPLGMWIQAVQTKAGARIDGVIVSPFERDIVRGLRKVESRIESARSADKMAARVAELVEIQEKGTPIEKKVLTTKRVDWKQD